MRTATASRQDWAQLVWLLRQRLPMLREATGPAERVYWAELDQADAGAPRLRVVTYGGRVREWAELTGYRLEVTRRDAQGVPLAWRLRLEQADGRASEWELFV